MLYTLYLLSSLFQGTSSFHGRWHVPAGGHNRCYSSSHRAKHRLSATLPQESTSSAGGVKDSDTASSLPDMKAYASGYESVFEETPFYLCQPIGDGEVPTDLVGTYFRSGPAMFSAGSIIPPEKVIVQPKQPPVPDGQNPDRMVKHPFEGDGGMLAVTFTPRNETSDGSIAASEVTARYRFIRTPGFTNERKKGSKLYDGMDSTRALGPGLENDFPLPLFRHHLLPGLNKKRKNTSNTRPVYWGKRLLSLWDGGQPFKVDALALSTEGRSKLGGAIPKDDNPFSCKMVYDPVKEIALFHAVEPGVQSSEIALYEFDSNFRLIPGGRKLTEVPGFAVVSDLAATTNYALMIQPPISVSRMKFMMAKEPGSVLNFEPNRPATVHLIPRVESRMAAASFSIPVDSLSDANLQFVNAYENGNEVVVDAIRSDPSELGKKGGGNLPSWPWSESLEEYRSIASAKSLWRYKIDTRNGSVSKEQLFKGHACFGTINPAMSTLQHRYIYVNVGATGAEAAPPQGIACFDCETLGFQAWMPETYEFCGEPLYAERVGGDAENSGYILSVLYNGKKKESEILVFEAADISKGPRVRLSLGTAIPHGLFGCFAKGKEATWSFEELQRRAKLADKMESRGNMWNEVKSDFSGLGLRFDDFEEYFGMDLNEFFTPPSQRK